MKKFIIFFLFVFAFLSGYSQYLNQDQYSRWTGRMGIGSPSSVIPNTGVHLQLGDSATTKALWLPRVQSTAAITAPRQGMFVYSISDSSVYYRDLNSWVNLSVGSSATPTWDSTMAAGSNITSSYVSDFNDNTWNWKNITDFTLQSDEGDTTRLKVSASESDLFSPNGSYGFIARDDEVTAHWDTNAELELNNTYSRLRHVDNSIMFEGGNTSLTNILNTTSSDGMGLLLINTSNGLLQYLSRDSLYSGAAAPSLAAVAAVGNATDTVINTAGIDAYQTYGTVWIDDFARASFGGNYITSGAGATYTFPSSAYLNITGNANVQTNYFARTDSTNENKGAITTRVVINTKAADSYGFYIGWGNLNTLCCNHQVMGGVSLTTGTNNLFFVVEAAGSVFTDAVSLSIANGDTLDITLSQSDWTYTLSYFNHRTDVTRKFSLSGFPAGGILPLTPNGFSRPEFHHLGGDMRVYSFSRVSNESKNARNVFMGNSLWLSGNITDPSQRAAHIATGNHANTIISAGGGSVASYSNSTWTADLSRYAAGSAENFWLMCGGNDSLFSVWENIGKPAAITLRNRVVASGKRFIWMTPMPRNSLNLSSVADTVVAIATRLGDPYVDYFHRFAVGTSLPSAFNSGDGTHLTATGNYWMGYYADSLYPQYTRQSSTTGLVKGYNGSFQKISLTGRYEWNYTASPLTATIPNDASYISINPSSTISIFTIQLPSNVDPGHLCIIHFGGTMLSGVVVNSLTMTPATGQTISRMPFAEPVLGVSAIPFGVGDEIMCRYIGSGKWEVIPWRTGYYTDIFVNGHAIGTGAGNTQTNLREGYAAMNSTSLTSNNSTAIGNQALQSLTSGVRNTAVGSKAALAITTGPNNTLIGEEAGGAGNSTNRTGVGYAVLFNATGSDLTGMGVNTMFSNTTGANNTAVGSGAAQNNATGSNNTTLGAFALAGVAANSNSNNTAVGFRALLGLTTGNGNIAIGDSAGTTLTTGIRNIIIGTNIMASSATANNEMNIGGLLFGRSMTATGTNAAGSLGVGVPAASITARLHLPAGTTAASSGPLKFTSGSLQTTAEAGTVEFLTDKWYATITTGAARKEFTLNDVALTSGRIPFTTTDGRLTDNANLSVAGAGALQIGSAGAPIAAVYSNTATLNFPSTSGGSSSDLTITVTGAALNDVVTLGVPNGSVPDNGTFFAWVSATNTVTVRYANNDILAAKDPASGTFRVTVTVF